MEGEDPYASIFEVCNCNQRSNNDIAVPSVQLPQNQAVGAGCFIDHFPESYGAIILPEDIDNYICRTPEASLNQHEHDYICHTPETSQNQHDHDYFDGHQSLLCLENGVASPPSLETPGYETSLCLENRMASPPYMESMYLSPDHPVVDIGNSSKLDGVDMLASTSCSASDHQDEYEDAGLLLSQLKSMARLEGFFDYAVSFVSWYKACYYGHLGPPDPSMKKLTLDSPSKSRHMVPSPVQRKPLAKRSKHDFVDPTEVFRSNSSSKKRVLGPLPVPMKSLESIEAERANVIVLTDSEEEEEH